MATALACGWLRAGLVRRENCRAADPVPACREAFAAATGIAAVADNGVVAAAADVLVLAVKPQDMDAALADLRRTVTAGHLLVSIAAGVTLSRLVEGLGPDCRLVRVMANTPCLVQCGAAAYSAGPHATADDVALIGRLMNAVGRAFALSEQLLDAVTGLSGSGPAFVFTMIEALSDGGVLMGLPRDVATTLAAQTLMGAAKMVLETEQHPAVLRDQVASPGGTTIAGIAALERGGVRAALIDAVAAATRRASDLGAD
jgi:pyrroline-5-carboxylate reductase